MEDSSKDARFSVIFPICSSTSPWAGPAVGHGTDTSQQFPCGKRLGKIIIRPAVQAQDVVLHLRSCCQHQDGNMVPTGPKLPQNVQAIQLGIIISNISAS